MISVILIFSLIILSSSVVDALAAYANRIPNGQNVKDNNGNPWAGVGHLNPNGGGARNPFGEAFQAANYRWTTGLCQQDSDLDGRTNGEELGDPLCVWVEGATPSRTTGITHPGFSGDVVGTVQTCTKFQFPTNSVNVTLKFSTPATLPNGVVTSYPRQAFDVTTLPGWPSGSGVSAAFRIDPILDRPDVIHHMLLYACTQAEANSFLAQPKYTGGMPCSKGLVFAWAIGAPSYCMPSNVALKLNAETPYLLLEVHMNNVGKTPIQVLPGFKFTVVSVAQIPSSIKYANWLWLGVSTNKITIPAKQKYYEISSTKTFPPSPGVTLNVFAQVLHAHYLGRKIWVEARSSTKNRLIACNANYDNANQDFVPLVTSVPLTDKDTIVVHCVYNSSTKTVVTTGGEETEDEMCFAFLLYVSDQVAQPLNFVSSSIQSGASPLPTSTSCLSLEESRNGIVFGGATTSWVQAHIVLGALSVGFLLPVAGLIASNLRKKFGEPKFIYVHFSLIIVGTIFVWATFGLGITNGSLLSAHGRLGLSIVVLSVFQVLLGCTSAGQRAFNKIAFLHRSLGKIIILLGFVQLFLGYGLAVEYLGTEIVIWGYIHPILGAVVWIILYLFGLRNSKNTANLQIETTA